jgi:hypothetical protein
MRILRLALAFAALAAAPAAAQPNAPALLNAVIDRLAADVAEVEDYRFTLAHAGVRVPVYVHRTGQAWRLQMPPTALSGLVVMGVFWPSLLDPSASVGLERARYLRDETVEGRPAHVIEAMLGAPPGLDMDSVRVLVDPATRRIVRLVVASAVPPEVGATAFGDGARMAIVIDVGSHRETDGLSLPGWLRIRMRLHVPNFTPAQRQDMLANLRQARAELRGSTEPQAQEMLAMLDVYQQLITPDGIDVRLQVENVAVNAGRPPWATR